jgi:hypothetical protein
MTKPLHRILSETFRFSDRTQAFSFAAGAQEALGVMLGDDERFWVTTPANCGRLQRMGYQRAD